MIHNIDAKTLKELLDKNEAVLVDVREPDEYAEQHIDGATLAPLATLALDNLPEHKNKKLVFQCKAGKRGGMACDKISGQDKTLDVYNLEGGILAWTQAGYQVQAGKAS